MKTVLVALVASAVTAGAVLFYVDRKVDQITEAVVAPLDQTAGVVSDSVESVASTVESTVESLAQTADSAVGQFDEGISGFESRWDTTEAEFSALWNSTETLVRDRWQTATETTSDLSTRTQDLIDSFTPLTMKEFEMATRQSIQESLAEAVESGLSTEDHRDNLADLLALAWDVTRNTVSADS